MSNRLKFYREQMAAFEGSADPQRAIESGYYVPEPKKSSNSLLTRVALRPAATHLLIGGIGAGKTTQLHVACKQLNEIEKVSAHYVDVSSYANISTLSQGTLIAITGLILSKLVPNSELQNQKNIVQKYAYGYPESSSTSSLAVLEKSIGGEKEIYHGGVLSSQKEISELKNAFKNLVKNVFSRYGDIIILFDGLDRLDKIQRFIQIIEDDVSFISSFGIGLVLVGPLMTAYSYYRDIVEPMVNYISYQYCFDIENELEAYSFFEDILNVRAKEGFIEPSAIQSLIQYSGGVLRDLINLTQSSIEESYISDEENLKQTHIEAAANSFGRAKLLGVSNQDLEILKKVSETGDFIPRTDREIRLLVTGRILEYKYPAKRFAVHPTIQPLMQ
jgi:hypothetical protein